MLFRLPYSLKCQFSLKLEVRLQIHFFYTRCKKSLNIRLRFPQPKGIKSISSFFQMLLHPKRPTSNLMQRCDALSISRSSLSGSRIVSAEDTRVLHSSSRTVHSASSVSIIIEAIAPSLNSKDVPPSTTIHASQQRERTQTLQKPKKVSFHKQLKKIKYFTQALIWTIRLVLRHSFAWVSKCLITQEHT